MQSVIKLVAVTVLLSLIQSCSKPKKYSLDKRANAVMIQILDSITRQNYNMDNPFSSQAQLAFFDNELKKVDNNPNKRTAAMYFKALTLLKLGKEKESIEIFKQLEARPGALNSRMSSEMMDSYALANLRYGERTNCITNHMAESCVFPIKGGGMYQDETGSRKAIYLYQQILTKNPNDLASRWLLNIAYMTLGEYPKKVPAAFLIPNLDVDSSGIKVNPFTDIAADLRFDTRNRAGGAIIDDFNNDGYLVVVISDMGLEDGPMHYFKNNCNGSFTDVTQQAGLGGFRGGLSMIQGDYNNDGYKDILILRGAWLPGQYGKQPNSLMRNNGDGTFTDVTISSGLLSFHPTQAAVWRDFNNDGLLDLFIGNETSNPMDRQASELYINNGDETFTNIAAQANCDIVGFIKGVTAADYNNDGWQDIFISTVSGTRTLLRNEGIKNGKVYFSNVTHEAGLDDIDVKTFPTWFWDYDNDGWPDIFVCGYDPGIHSIAYAAAAQALQTPDPTASKMYLYHNNHNGTFTNVSAQAGLNQSVFSMGSNFGDFDNDGYLDMYLGTGNPDFRSLAPNKLFKNIGGKKFTDVTSAARVGNLQKGHGVSFADLDNDGDQDIFVEVGGAFTGDAYYNSLYQNPGQNNNRWININLEGVKSNRNAIGARIKLTFKENGTTRAVCSDENSGGSFGCSPLRKEIGIGQANMIDEIAVTWPASGETQVFINVQPCQFITIKQGSSEIVKNNVKQLNFKGQHKDMANCNPATTVGSK